MIKKYSYLIFIVLMSFLVKGQSDRAADSLLRLIASQKDDTLKVYHYSNLTKHYQVINPREAESTGKKGLALAKKLNFKRGEAITLQNLGEFYNASGNYAMALESFLAASKLFEELSEFKRAANTSNSIGNTYLGLGNNEKAMEFYKRSYDQSEVAKNEVGMAVAAVGISSIYKNQKNYQEAIKELIFAKTAFKNYNKQTYLAFSFANLADVYNELDNYDSAKYYAEQAIPIMEEVHNRYGLSLSYLTLGNIEHKKEKYNIALNNYFKAMQIAEEDKAIDNLKDINYQIYQLFEKKGNSAQALLYYKKYTALKDSVYNSEGRNKLFELQTKYDTETKEKENRLLQQDKEIAEKTLQQQKTMSYFIGGILILVFVFSYISYKNLKKQKRMNVILHQQKELVEQSRKEILDSIMYAKRIQSTILAHKEFIDDHISRNFVYFKPKDIVSGDFYWATKKDNLFYLAVCDSTGHGVPGAFMSLLSISFLNEAIGEKNITRPNEVFNYVRKKLIENISKEGQKDGFDGVLLCLNQDTKEITYSAANNKPIVVTDNQIIELESDRMPVGYGERKEDFKLHSLKLKKEDTLYLFTDGYADQFGGPKGKKLMYKKLYEFLLNISAQPLEKQTDALGENFESWKGPLEQVDDVCVIGLKFS